MSRNLNVYASQYQPERIHVVRLPWRSVATLVVDFTGAMPAGTAIASVTWRGLYGGLSGQAITGKKASIVLGAGWWCDEIEVTATLGDGSVISQAVQVKRSLVTRWWGGTPPTAYGGYQELTVTV